MSVLGGLLVLFGAIAPDALTLPNRLWMKLGFLLGLIMTPIVMGLLYLLTFIPMGLALRLAGKDPLRRRKKGEGESYWVVRDPAGPDPKTMTNQF
jgi:hypothetical protein